MINITAITDALPVVSYDFTVTPADFQDVPFTPALLLPYVFDASLTTHADFLSGCEVGFDTYFEEMFHIDGTDERFTDHFHTWDEVKSFIIHDAFPDPVGIRYCAVCGWESTSLAWRAGFCLGWLSALALTDRPLALQGLSLLARLVFAQSTSVQGGVL